MHTCISSGTEAVGCLSKSKDAVRRGNEALQGMIRTQLNFK